MRNVTVTTKGNKMIIEVDVSEAVVAAGTPSSSGRTKVFATTGGNKDIDIGGGRSITLGLNAYTK